LRQRTKLRVHHQHAVPADLQRDVSSRAREQINVSLYRLHTDLNVLQVLLLSAGRNRRAEREYCGQRRG